MSLSAVALHVLRASIVLVALGSAVLPAAPAARRHDAQAILIPPTATAPHDHARGPTDRDLR